MKDLVTFKGNARGLELMLDPDGGFDELVQRLKEKLSDSMAFFKDSKLSITLSGRALNDVEQSVIQREIWDAFGEQGDVQFITPAECGKPVDKTLKPTKFVRGTIRSGNSLDVEGCLVLMGDINPGAEVAATGDIVVLGAIRGMVHAGSAGDRGAVVSAMKLQPSQLRIGDIYTRPPDNDVRIATKSEFAYVKNDDIYIEPLN